MYNLFVISQGFLVALLIIAVLIGLSILLSLNKLSDMSIEKRK